ncbi:MAG: metallophosphoesterase [Clostridia bacterium]|nr:metallophosphoesterase [Clostridia bacterium]
MIFVTGDTHIPTDDISKLKTKKFPKQMELTKNDYVIICGDFGGIWNGNRKDNYWLNWLEKKNFTTLFVDGNHENFPALAEYEECSWNGGKVQFIRPSVIHLMRGYVFDLEGMKIFAMGGARSYDRIFRKEGVTWWPEEMPSEEEIRRARQNLALNDNQVDIMITHDAPQSIARMIDFAKSQDDELMPFFDELKNTVGYRHWYFGHFHEDWKIDECHTVVYNKIIQL